MVTCGDSQPSPSDCTTNGAFPFLHIVCRLMLGAAAPSHLSRFAVTLGIIPLFFRRRLLALRTSLADRGPEDATLGLKSFTIAVNAPAKGKRPLVQNNPSLWQVLFAFLILVVSECAWGSTETKMCMFGHLLLCSNAPWLHRNLYCSISHCFVKTHTFMDIYFVCVCVKEREKERESEGACALSNVCPAAEVSQGGIYQNLS